MVRSSILNYCKGQKETNTETRGFSLSFIETQGHLVAKVGSNTKTT